MIYSDMLHDDDELMISSIPHLHGLGQSINGSSTVRRTEVFVYVGRDSRIDVSPSGVPYVQVAGCWLQYNRDTGGNSSQRQMEKKLS